MDDKRRNYGGGNRRREAYQSGNPGDVNRRCADQREPGETSGLRGPAPAAGSGPGAARAGSGDGDPLELLTVEQVADLLQVSRDKVYYLLRTGQLRSVKIGKLRRISRAWIAEFLTARLGAASAARS